MKKIFRGFALLIMSASVFVACSSNDDVKPEGEAERPVVDAPKASAEEVKEELKNIIVALKEFQADDVNGASISEFITQLESDNVAAETNHFTVLAVEDANPTVVEDGEAEARVAYAAGGRRFNMNYHILAGKIDFKHIGADKDYVYKTINGDDVMISKRNNVVYVNGVAMKKNDYFKHQHGKGSHIYCVKDEVPTEQESIHSNGNKEGAYDIRVMNIEQNGVLKPSKDAVVVAFEEVGKGLRFIQNVRTNDDGYATVIYKGNNNVVYKAGNRQYSYIYYGFLIDGIYNKDNIKNKLIYENVRIKGQLYDPQVGDIALVDLNGDAKITNQDKAGRKFQKLDKGAELNMIHLASK